MDTKGKVAADTFSEFDVHFELDQETRAGFDVDYNNLGAILSNYVYLESRAFLATDYEEQKHSKKYHCIITDALKNFTRSELKRLVDQVCMGKLNGTQYSVRVHPFWLPYDSTKLSKDGAVFFREVIDSSMHKTCENLKENLKQYNGDSNEETKDITAFFVCQHTVAIVSKQEPGALGGCEQIGAIIRSYYFGKIK